MVAAYAAAASEFDEAHEERPDPRRFWAAQQRDCPLCGCEIGRYDLECGACSATDLPPYVAVEQLDTGFIPVLSRRWWNLRKEMR
jgi:hypothetical protein